VRARALCAAVAVATVTLLSAVAACDATFRFDEPPPSADGADGAANEGGGPRVPCVSDATCGGMRCDKTDGVCVACLEDGDCASPLARCDRTLHVCVACKEREDCAKTERCDVTTHRCLDACDDDDDLCPQPGFVCDKSLALCVECRSSANCAGSPNGTVCDVPIGRCVECTGNAQCPAETPTCDRRTGRCAGCVSSAGCATGACDPVKLVCH